jgi:hypothetical protein
MIALADLDKLDRKTLERARDFMATDLTVDELLANERLRIVLHGAVNHLAKRRSNLNSRQLKPIDQFPRDTKRLAAHDVDD